MINLREKFVRTLSNTSLMRGNNPRTEVKGSCIMPAKSDFKAKGIICQNKKDWPGAINAFHKSLSLNPKDTETWFNLGLSFFNNKQYSEANNAYQKALS